MVVQGVVCSSGCDSMEEEVAMQGSRHQQMIEVIADTNSLKRAKSAVCGTRRHQSQSSGPCRRLSGASLRSSRLLGWQSRDSGRRCCAPGHRWRDQSGPDLCQCCRHDYRVLAGPVATPLAVCRHVDSIKRRKNRVEAETREHERRKKYGISVCVFRCQVLGQMEPL